MSSPQQAARGPDPGKWASIALSVLMHAVLIGLLIYGIRWQSSPPASVEVDLVRALPAQPAVAKPEPKPEPPPEPKVEPPPKPAPKPVAYPQPPRPEPEPKVESPPPKPVPKSVAYPEPPRPKPEPKPEPKAEPKPPEIAIKAKPEPPKPAPPPKPVATPQPEPRAEAQRLIEEQLKREALDLEMKKLARQAEHEAEVLRERAREQQLADARARAVADYIAKVRAKIRGNIVLPPDLRGNPEAVFEVSQLPTGEVLSPVRLKRSSGNPALDAAIERAILKSSPLPKAPQPELFSRVLELKFRPLED